MNYELLSFGIACESSSDKKCQDYYERVKEYFFDEISGNGYMSEKSANVLDKYKSVKVTKEFMDKYKPSYPMLKHFDIKDNCAAWMDGDKIVGVCSVNKEDDDYGYRWITMIEVTPEYRKQGVGTALLDYCVKKFHADALGVRKTNKAALSIYRKYGFHVMWETDRQFKMTLK